MPQPNVGQGQGRLRRRRAEQREAYEAYRASQRSDARAAENRAREQAARNPTPPPAGNSGGSSAPAAPQYGPFRRRAERDADLLYGQQVQQAQAGIENAGSWFEQYKKDVAAANQQIAARYQAAQGQVQQPMVQSAAPTMEGGLAAQSRQSMGQAFQNLLTAQGAAQQDYFTGRGTVGSAQQLQSRLQGQKQVDALQRERGQYVLSRRDELRDQAHTRRLERKVFDLDEAKATADAADAFADNRRAAREDRRARREKGQEVNQYGYSNRDWQAMTPEQRREAMRQKAAAERAPKTPGSGGGRFTPNQLATSRKTFRKVFQDIKRNDNGTQTYGQDIRKTLTGAGADSLLVRAAWQLYSRGRVDGRVARALRRDYGITVKDRAPRKRPDPYTPPADSPGSDAAQGNATNP